MLFTLRVLLAFCVALGCIGFAIGRSNGAVGEDVAARAIGERHARVDTPSGEGNKPSPEPPVATSDSSPEESPPSSATAGDRAEAHELAVIVVNPPSDISQDLVVEMLPEGSEEVGVTGIELRAGRLVPGSSTIARAQVPAGSWVRLKVGTVQCALPNGEYLLDVGNVDQGVVGVYLDGPTVRSYVAEIVDLTELGGPVDSVRCAR